MSNIFKNLNISWYNITRGLFMNNEKVPTFEEYKKKYLNFYINFIETAKKTLKTDTIFLDGKQMDLDSYLEHGYQNKLKAIEFRNKNKIL